MSDSFPYLSVYDLYANLVNGTVSSYCAKFPTVGAKISGNYHGMSSPAEAKINATNTSDIAWGAVFANAVIGLDVSDNLDHRSRPLSPLLVGGSNRQLFVAKDVRVSGNLGFQASPSGYYEVSNPWTPIPGGTVADPWPGSGWLRLIGSDVGPSGGPDVEPASVPGTANPSVMRGCMDYHTLESDRVRVRNFLPANTWESVSAAPKTTNASDTPPVLTKTNEPVDGDAVWEWSQKQQEQTTSVLLGELDLSANPSVANRTVFLAADTRLLFNATLELLMDGGDGVWHTSGTGTEHMHISNVPETNAIYQCGDAQQGSRLWAVSSFQLQLAAAGTARFGLRLSDVEGSAAGAAVLQLRKVGAAIVGTGWNRMFAAPTVPTGASCGRKEEKEEKEEEEKPSAVHAELALLKRELSLLRAELREQSDDAAPRWQ